MKPLHEMNNIEKAALLFELFPSEIKRFISFTETIANEILINPEKIKEDWNKNDTLLTVERWIELAIDTKEKIDNSFIELTTNSNVFSEQLFKGQISQFVIDCLQKYISFCPN